MKKLAYLVLPVVMILFSYVPAVHAAVFTANDAASLIAAVTSANATPGFDIITLTGNVTLTTTAEVFFGNNGLPVINSDMRIDGGGNTISRVGGLCNVAAPDRFRFFYVNTGRQLHLHNLTLNNGCDINDSGGAIRADNGGATVILTRVTAQNNTSLRDGGAILSFGSLQVYDSVFTGNVSGVGGDGGAILIASGATGRIVGSTFSNNITEGPFGGGGIASAGNLTIRTSTFSNNQANLLGGGGGLELVGGTVTIENSTFNGNSSAQTGGGISVDFGTVTIRNSTFSANTAQAGGGLNVNNTGNVTLNNTTFVNNVSATQGGGINRLSGTVTLNNSIVSGNTAGVNGNCAGTIGGANNGSNNADCPGITANVVVGTDVSAVLANNGGPTQTHALLAGSNAIDASGAGATNGDQRGAIAVGTRDMGAFEFGAFTAPTLSFTTPPPPALPFTILETGGAIEITLTSTSRVVGQIIVPVFDTPGTAAQGVDYTSFFQTVTIDCDTLVCDAATPQTVITTIFPTEDNLVEVDETLNLNMVVDGTATVGTPRQAVTIRDFAELHLSAIVPNASENPPTSGQFTIFLTTITSTGATIPVINDTGADIVVTYIIGGTATPGADYTPLSGTAIIPVGQGAVTVDVVALPDGVAEPPETVVLTLNCACLPLNITVQLAPATVTITDSPLDVVAGAAGASGSSGGTAASGTQFDPAINKLGFTQNGQIAWKITVSNPGAVAGSNVIVTDTLDSRLRIDEVDAPGGTVSISGQTVTITYAVLNPGDIVIATVLTTLRDGTSVSNTACVDADNQAAAKCFTGAMVSQLPSTGEIPAKR